MSYEQGLVTSIVHRLEGKQRGTFNERDKWVVKCPYCDFKRAMIGSVKTGDYFLFKCHSCDRSISLKELVKDKFPGMYQEENAWHPIKNRCPEGVAKHRRSFKERQESKSVAREIMMRSRMGQISSQ